MIRTPIQTSTWPNQLCRLLLLTAICTYSAAIEAEETAPAEAAQTHSAAQINQWLNQLNDDRFDARQNAQQQLTQTRPVPLEEVAAAAQTGSLESTTRALNILINWSESKDELLRLAALHKLAEMTHRPREATMATRLLADNRERIALAALIKLGAYVNDRRIGGIANRQIQLDKRWTGGDEGLKHLRDVRRVVTLSLYSAPVTDQGLKHLTQLPEVRKIELFGIKASKTGIEKLKDQLPPDTVDARSGALLGVRGDLGNQSEVTDVVPESAAAKAGILPGDRITEINGDEVEDFKALTRRIADYQPGDTVTLTIERNNKVQKVKATFDQWGADEKMQQAAQRMNIIQVPRAVPRKQVLPPRNKVEPR